MLKHVKQVWWFWFTKISRFNFLFLVKLDANYCLKYFHEAKCFKVK